jgi:hypothetical protein
VTIEGFGKKFSVDEKAAVCVVLPPIAHHYSEDMPSVSYPSIVLQIFAQLSCIEALKRGKVSLTNQDNIFWLIEDVGNNTTHDQPPRRIYFCRQIGIGARHLIGLFDVKKRDYIGTTSMDAELSLVMANMGKVCIDSRLCTLYGRIGWLVGA